MLLMETVLNHRIELEGKPVDITLSEAARDALSRRTKPLAVEMELYFSCLIRKQVRFRDASKDDPHGAELNDRLRIYFRPVMTRACGMDHEGDEPPLTDFPLAKRRPYIPHWLRIDFRDGQWAGEFGYHEKH